MTLLVDRRCHSTRCALPRPMISISGVHASRLAWRRAARQPTAIPRMQASSTVLVKNVRNKTCEGNQRMQVSSRKSVSRLIRNKSSFMRSALDTLYDEFNAAHAVADPVWFAHRFTAAADREVVAFIASALAFGRVQSVLNSIECLLAVMGPSPAAFV